MLPYKHFWPMKGTALDTVELFVSHANISQTNAERKS